MFGDLFKKIKQGLARRRSLFSSIAELFRFKGRVDQKFLDELEKRLYLADVGTFATQEIVERRAPGVSGQGNHRRHRDVRQGAARDRCLPRRTAAFAMPHGPNGGDDGRRQRLGQDDVDRQAGQALPGRRQEGDGRRVRHLPGRRRRSSSPSGANGSAARSSRTAGQRPGQRRPRRLRKGQGPRLRRRHRGHRRPAAHARLI